MTHDTAFSDVIFINQMREFPGFLLQFVQKQDSSVKERGSSGIVAETVSCSLKHLLLIFGHITVLYFPIFPEFA